MSCRTLEIGTTEGYAPRLRTDILIANNWADLTDGAIQVSLQTALASTANYWTFSLSQGQDKKNATKSLPGTLSG